MKKYFFCGIGGSGMSALALILKNKGKNVCGSDRSYDAGLYMKKFAALRKQGITLFAQDASGIDNSIDAVVVSSAVEENVADIVKARQIGLPILTRAKVLADFLHEHNGIAVGGTSGKTTTTGMIGHILKETRLDPCVINGGVMLNYETDSALGNVILGKGTFCVIEADESDGSIEMYKPAVSVVTSISLDHKPIDELKVLFGNFVQRASVGAVLNADCPDVMDLKERNPNVLTFSVQGKKADLSAINITPVKNGVQFFLDKERVFLPVIGKHNVANALAALACAEIIGIPRSQAIVALKSFKGIHRRMELIGITKKGIAVIDDFAHNPEKIAATLSALKEYNGRIIVVYQPHGFKPTKIMRQGIVDAFANGLDSDDILIMQEIYYAGGTTQKDISANDLVKDLEKSGKQAFFIEDRDQIEKFIKQRAGKGDRIVIMGARDETLTNFAWRIYEAVA